ncbi:MAG: hypothetical protein ABUK15_05685, partial [Anaerolineales bacterium]
MKCAEGTIASPEENSGDFVFVSPPNCVGDLTNLRWDKSLRDVPSKRRAGSIVVRVCGSTLRFAQHSA